MTQENIATASIPAPTFLRSYDDLAVPAANQFTKVSAKRLQGAAADHNLTNVNSPSQCHQPPCYVTCSSSIEPLDQFEDLDLVGTGGGHSCAICSCSREPLDQVE